jgi:two-component system phosphate regulon response regulator PhoB
MSKSGKSKVLIVEDERDVAELMALHLKREGHETTAVEDGEEAFKILKLQGYDLVILDWMLPGVSGLEILKRVKAQSPVPTYPILMVTARADTSDIVLGLEMGADDYITKPFEIPVFLARVRALLRRSQVGVSTDTNVLRIGALSMEVDAHQVYCGKEALQLTPSEFRLLHALMTNQGRVLSRERLIDLVQGQGVAVVDRAIDTHVFGLRKKMGECADVIETIRGVGYRVKG